MEHDKKVLLFVADGPEVIEIYTSEDEAVVDMAKDLPSLYITVHCGLNSFVKLGPFGLSKNLIAQLREPHMHSYCLACEREAAARQDGVDWEYRHHHDAEHDCCVNCQLERIAERKAAVQAFAEKAIAQCEDDLTYYDHTSNAPNAVKLCVEHIRALAAEGGDK